MKAPATKAPAKRKKSVSARTICRKVIDQPGISKRTGQLLKGWHYVKGKPVKVTKGKTVAKKKVVAKKPALKAPAKNKTAAQKTFAVNSAKARQLVKSGKVKTLKAAWALLKK
jgi:hypothetical protein